MIMGNGFHLQRRPGIWTAAGTVVTVVPTRRPRDILASVNLIPWTMHKTSRLHVLPHIVLLSFGEDLRDELDGCRPIDKWNEEWMDQNIRLRLHIDQAVMSTVQILAIVDIFPDDTKQ